MSDGDVFHITDGQDFDYMKHHPILANNLNDNHYTHIYIYML